MATTYISNSDAEDYVGHEVTDALINQAEQDIDDLALGAYPRAESAPFRKIDPDEISAFQEDGLKRATGEQIKYRELMGDAFFVKPQRDSGSAEGVSFSGKLPHLSPRALAILADSGLVKTTGRVIGSSSSVDLEDIGYH